RNKLTPFPFRIVFYVVEFAPNRTSAIMKCPRLFTGIVLGLALFGPFQSLRAEATRLPLLMPDDFTDMHLVAWRIEPGVLDPHNPLAEGERPGDRGGVGIHGSVFRDPIDGKWKAYLVCTPAEEYPEKQPENRGKPWASENAAHRRVCLFESDDGIKWTRPLLD